ncbi:MAG TPA: Ig-like domain-containing protein [Prolixibacteraceae bacterium]|nr:Ig-like domain-containing protein [Prolixibacteraceae bacterium]
MKKLKLLAFFATVSFVFLNTCKKDDYIATIGVCPLVESTTPIDKAVGVPFDQMISATFNEKMNPVTINEASFTLQSTPTSTLGLKSAMVATPVSGTVTYSGETAMFSPSSPLLPDATYIGTIKTSIKDLNGNFLQQDYVWTFTTDASPTMVSTSPATQASGVPLDKIITASFSEAMDPTSITSLTYTISQGTTLLEGTVSYTDLTASFTPTSNLLPNTIYTGTITTAAKNVAGLPMTTNYVWTFTTGLLPSVTATIPTNNATNVALDQSVTATFSMPMDPLTINGTTVSLTHGAVAVEGTVSYSELIATFIPASNLLPSTLYTVTITTGTKNESGISLVSNYVWTFTTAAAVIPTVISTDPPNLAIDVVLDKTVTATFSVPMDPLTISSSTFTLTQGVTTVAGTVTYSGSTASYNPTANLLPNTVYTATIKAGAKDLAGTSLASDYIWTFTTAIAPTVISTSPQNNATGVSLDKTVTATFSVPMDPSTISSATFTLIQGTSTTTGVITYSGTMASFNPPNYLLPNTLYTATITTGATNVAGMALENNYVWTFTTASGLAIAPTVISTDPINNATNVALNQTIEAIFSVPMNPLTITTSSFTLKNGINSIGGNVSCIGSTASFNPVYDLFPGTTYTATITVGAENVAGESLDVDYVWKFTTAGDAIVNPIIVNLNSAGNFVVLAGSGISNIGTDTRISGDAGSFPSATINGLLALNVIDGGTLYTTADPIVGQAKTDLTTAYNDAQARSLNAISLPGQLGGLTLTPGLYVNSSTSGISGTGPNGILTLDAGGDPNAVWIFKMGSTLVTDAGTSIVLAGNANADNIFWSVGSSATLGTNSVFFGNILADQSITLTTGATLTGRALTRIGAITLESNIITKP